VFKTVSLLIVALIASPVGAANSVPSSDPQALKFAAQSVAAMTGGAAVSDVTLNANVISIPGSARKTGSGTFCAKGFRQSRMDLVLSAGTLSETRAFGAKGPSGAWARNNATPIAQVSHNTQTDAAWFFPALSSLGQFANPDYLFRYIGQEQHEGVNTQHIQIALVTTFPTPGVQALSMADFYLDSATLLPLSMAFRTHPDEDENTNISVEILFTNYQSVGGILIPMHFQRTLAGALVLDATVASASLNAGIADSTFDLQ
jgi:hypothetical protein